MKKSELRLILLLVVIVAASFGITWTLLNQPSSEVYSVNSGLLSYTGRPAVSYTQEVWNETDEKIIYKVVYQSHGQASVYGLLAVPKLDGPLPAFYVLPGATVTKEGIQGRLGNDLNELGFVTLSLDQRGHGETGGYILPFEMDYTFWAEGQEPMQHMMAYDAVRAFDLLNQLPGIDKSRIYAAGESMGGNYAMIATGMEPRIAGILLISSSGFKFEPQRDPKAAQFLKSIVGDSYLDLFPPRPIVMLHAVEDSVVPIGHAQETFEMAKEPKLFLTIDSSQHAYNHEFRDILEQGIEGW